MRRMANFTRGAITTSGDIPVCSVGTQPDRAQGADVSRLTEEADRTRETDRRNGRTGPDERPGPYLKNRSDQTGQTDCAGLGRTSGPDEPDWTNRLDRAARTGLDEPNRRNARTGETDGLDLTKTASTGPMVLVIGRGAGGVTMTGSAERRVMGPRSE